MGGQVTGTRNDLLQEGASTITVGRGRPAAAAHTQPTWAPCTVLDWPRFSWTSPGD